MNTPLHLVPACPAFAFDHADFHVPIPEDTLALAREDAPAADTPYGLEYLRMGFSDQEGDLMRGGMGTPIFVPLRELIDSHSAGVVPYVTLHYATTKAREVFTQWQASRPHRVNVQLRVRVKGGEDGGWLRMKLALAANRNDTAMPASSDPSQG